MYICAPYRPRGRTVGTGMYPIDNTSKGIKLPGWNLRLPQAHASPGSNMPCKYSHGCLQIPCEARNTYFQPRFSTCNMYAKRECQFAYGIFQPKQRAVMDAHHQSRFCGCILSGCLSLTDSKVHLPRPPAIPPSPSAHPPRTWRRRGPLWRRRRCRCRGGRRRPLLAALIPQVDGQGWSDGRKWGRGAEPSAKAWS